MTSLHSVVYWPVSIYIGGCVRMVRISFIRSPLMLQMMWNQLGSSVLTGWTFRATGLYFLPAKMTCSILVSSIVYVGVC